MKKYIIHAVALFITLLVAVVFIILIKQDPSMMIEKGGLGKFFIPFAWPLGISLGLAYAGIGLGGSSILVGLLTSILNTYIIIWSLIKLGTKLYLKVKK